MSRVWDLTVLPSLQSSRPSSVRAVSSPQLGGTPRRSSFSNLSSFSVMSSRKLFGSSSSPGTPGPPPVSGLLPVPCSATLKPRGSAELGKVSGCAVVRNPYLYPGRVAFVFANRTEHIYLAVSSLSGKTSEDLPSETASAHSGESPTPAEGARELILLETLFVGHSVCLRSSAS